MTLTLFFYTPFIHNALLYRWRLLVYIKAIIGIIFQNLCKLYESFIKIIENILYARFIENALFYRLKLLVYIIANMFQNL